MKERIKKISSMLLTILLVVLLLGAHVCEKLDQRAYRHAFDEYDRRIAGYQLEWYKLYHEMISRKRVVVYYGERAKIMVGFAITNEDDISYIREKAEIYQFVPILVIDSNIDASRMEAILETADTEWEIMLYMSSLTDKTVQNITSLKARLETLGRKDCGVVFYRTESLTTEELAIFRASGFIGHTRYHDSPVSGQLSDGTVYFDYARIASDYLDLSHERQSLCYAKNASMIHIFDMESMRAGYISEQNVTAFLRILSAYAERETCSFATVAETISDLSEINRKKEEIASSRLENIKLIEKRLDDLEKRMREVADECFVRFYSNP